MQYLLINNWSYIEEDTILSKTRKPFYAHEKYIKDTKDLQDIQYFTKIK